MFQVKFKTGHFHLAALAFARRPKGLVEIGETIDLRIEIFVSLQVSIIVFGKILNLGA